MDKNDRKKATGKKRSSSSRREEIIEQAAKIFHEKGFTNATLKDVVDELEMTAPALYYHVKNKEEILFEIYQKTLRMGLNTMNRIAEDSISPKEKLKKAIEGYVSLVADNLDIFTVFFQEKHQLTAEHFEVITEQEKKFVKTIQDMYEQGVENGEFIKLDSAIVVNGIIGLCSWIYKWYNPNEGLDVTGTSDIFYRMIFKGLEDERMLD